MSLRPMFRVLSALMTASLPAKRAASDEGFRREKFLYGARARYRMAYGYWQFAVRMNFTAPT